MSAGGRGSERASERSGKSAGFYVALGLVPTAKARVGGRPITVAAAAMETAAVCIAERVQVLQQRNGTVAKEAALRWSALTRPVGRASGATVVSNAPRSVACRRLRKFAIAHAPATANCKSRSPVVNTSRQRERNAPCRLAPALLETFFFSPSVPTAQRNFIRKRVQTERERGSVTIPLATIITN